MAKRDALTPKQAAFVQHYLQNGHNGAAAYRAAYKSQATAQVASNEGQKLLEHPAISVLIASARSHAAAQLELVTDRYAISKERIALELAKIAFGDPRDAKRDLDELTADQAAALHVEALTTESDAGTVRAVRVRAGERRQALMDLAKLHGYVQDKPEPVQQLVVFKIER